LRVGLNAGLTSGLALSFDTNRLLWVSPDRIQNAGQWRIFDKVALRGQVRGGDWDQHTIPFDQLPAAHALRQHFAEGLPWDQTDYAWDALDRILDGHILKRLYPTKESWDARLQEIEELYQDICARGLLSKAEIHGPGNLPSEDEITVWIGRNGQLLFEDGQHRLAIAKILKIPEIPFKVTVRHPEWVRFRNQLLAYARENGGMFYQPLTHPDLSDIPSYHDDHRWNLIEQSLPIQQGTVLDIGANIGYFCHKLEAQGFDCCAVEASHQVGYFLDHLRMAEARHFKIFIGSIFEYCERKDFDVVLALNIFHHFLKTREDYEALVQLLSRLQMNYMYLETHDPDEPQMVGAYRNYTSEQYVQFILDHSNLTTARLIGDTEPGRKLYLLSKD
jgi:hypothetical protein